MVDILQVDVMPQMEMNPMLHQLQPSRISPQNVLQPLNDLNAPQLTTLSLQNVLQPNSDLNSVQMNQLSPQPQQHRQPTPHQQVNQENDELNTPTVSATGLDEHENVQGNTYGDDSQRMTQLTSGDIAVILGEPGNLSQNFSNLSFE